MGSLITLGIGEMEIDWGKNSSVNNHSVLFQQSDLKTIPYYCINYDAEEPLIKMNEAFSRKLKHVKSRLDLLGYDLRSIETHFNECVQDHENHGCVVPLTFDAFFNLFKELDLSVASTVKHEVEGYDNGYDLGEYVSECVLQIPEINQKLVGPPPKDRFAWSGVVKDLSIFLENLDPYITLRILAENPVNLDLEVQWNFSDALDGGWLSHEDIFGDLSPGKRVLIVTEGSSDSFVIKKLFKKCTLK